MPKPTRKVTGPQPGTHGGSCTRRGRGKGTACPQLPHTPAPERRSGAGTECPGWGTWLGRGAQLLSVNGQPAHADPGESLGRKVQNHKRKYLSVRWRHPSQIGAPQMWVHLECSHPSNVQLITGTHTNDSRSQKNSAQELDFCSVLATCLWFLTAPMSVLPESVLRAASRCRQGFKAASEGLGCRRYVGCPGVSFILQGQLSASTKQSPRVRGQAILQFVLLQPEHYPRLQ